MKPTREDFQSPEEVLIVQHEGPDNLGRSVFTAYWLARNEWRHGSGVHGQVFVTDLDKFVDGHDVRFLEEAPA